MAHELPANTVEEYGGLFFGIAKWAYNVTDGYFWAMMLLGFCVVLFIGTQRFGTTRSFGFAAFVGLLASIWLATMQLMAWWVASIFILTGAIGFVVMIVSER